MAWTVEYYQDERGHYPVREFLDTLPEGDQARILQTTRLLEEFGLQLGAPYVKAVRGKLWNCVFGLVGPGIVFCISPLWDSVSSCCMASLKKTAKTPRREIEIAEQRMADFIARRGVKI